MLGKISWPAAGKLAGPPRAGITSPRIPLECKNYDQGGVGLGIVVALDKPSNITSASYGGGEILAKYAICGPFSARSSPIPVNLPAKAKEMEMEVGEGLDEEFTYVTCHGSNKSVSSTRVYYDRGDGRNRIQLCEGRGRKVGVFKISSSPARLFEDTCPSESDSDFLSSCHLCRKALHGEDIYMYRGEKAFCSTECRQRQIRIDERREKRRSDVSRSNDVVSSSPYNCTSRGDQIFSNGIIAV